MTLDSIFGGLKCQNKCLCCYRRILSTFFIPFVSEARKCECFVRHNAVATSSAVSQSTTDESGKALAMELLMQCDVGNVSREANIASFLQSVIDDHEEAEIHTLFRIASPYLRRGAWTVDRTSLDSW